MNRLKLRLRLSKTLDLNFPYLNLNLPSQLTKDEATKDRFLNLNLNLRFA
jgi:hypothetical protein